MGPGPARHRLPLRVANRLVDRLNVSEGTRAVKVAVPREIENNEYRVALTPAGVHELVAAGHDVAVETGAGLGSAITDDDFREAGASILPDADAVWAAGDLVL